MSQLMMRVAVIAESGRLRSELTEIFRDSGRVELVCCVASFEDFDFLGPEQIDGIDVLLIDASATSAASSRAREDLAPALVVLSDDAETVSLVRSMSGGGALLPTAATAEQIIAAVSAAAVGLISFHADHPSPGAQVAEAGPLTPREHEVLQMLAAGLGNKAIASRLGISDHTAKFHVAQILAKLDAATRAEAVSIAMRRGLVPL